MTLLVMVAAALGFFVLLMASIALHEVGHLLPAKLFGVKVTQYFVGFGRTLWSTRRGDTEYGLKLLPLGGYVRMVGMYPPRRPGQVESRSLLARWADDARSLEYEDITSADDGRLFHQKPVWQKVVVMICGPLMNLFLAFAIMLGINLAHGQYTATLVADAVSECVIPAGAARACTSADPVAPSREAGVRPGDRIVSLNGVAATSWQQLSDQIRTNGGGAAQLVVERDGTQVTLKPTHTIVTGRPDRLDPGRTVEVGFLGVTPTYELQRRGIVATGHDLADQARRSTQALVTFPVKTWNVLVGMVTGRERDASGPVSIVGASRAAGEIATTTQLGTGDKVASWFSMLASVNLFVFLLNLVPLPPLDGGQIVGALYEGIKRPLFRLLGRGDPGHVDTARMLPVSYAVGGFLMLAGAVLVVADLVSPVAIF